MTLHRVILTQSRQNNARLEELSNKATALRGVTVDIYDNARQQDLIDSNNEHFSNMGSSLSASATRLTRMAASGNKIAVLKLAGIISVVIILLWWIKGFFF